MWDLLGSEIEPVSRVLSGRFLSTVPPGKSSKLILWFINYEFMVHSRWCTLLKAFIFKAVRCKSSFKSASVFCWLHESSCLWMGKDSTLETLHLCGHLEAWDPFAPFSSAWVPYWRVILANSCGQSVLRNKCPVSTASCLKGLCREAKLWVTLEKQRQEEASRWKGEMDQSIPPCPREQRPSDQAGLLASSALEHTGKLY